MRGGVGILAGSVALVLFVGIAAGSSAPLVTAGLDQDVVMGDTVYLDGYGTHVPDGELADLQWSIETPEGTTVTPECVDCTQTSFEPTVTGKYAVTLTARSASGIERADTLYVTVSTGGTTATTAAPSGGGGCFVSNTGGDDDGKKTMSDRICDHHGRALGYEWFNESGNIKGLRFENEGLANKYSRVKRNPDGTVTVPVNIFEKEVDNLLNFILESGKIGVADLRDGKVGDRFEIKDDYGVNAMSYNDTTDDSESGNDTTRDEYTGGIL